MSISLQGASSSSGRTGFHSGTGQPVNGNRPTREPKLTLMKQTSREQSIPDQIRKLSVRLLIDVLDRGIDEMAGGTSIPLTRSRSGMRCDSLYLTNYPPDRSIEVTCNEGKD